MPQRQIFNREWGDRRSRLHQLRTGQVFGAACGNVRIGLLNVRNRQVHEYNIGVGMFSLQGRHILDDPGGKLRRIMPGMPERDVLSFGIFPLQPMRSREICRICWIRQLFTVPGGNIFTRGSATTMLSVQRGKIQFGCWCPARVDMHSVRRGQVCRFCGIRRVLAMPRRHTRSRGGQRRGGRLYSVRQRKILQHVSKRVHTVRGRNVQLTLQGVMFTMRSWKVFDGC